MNPLYVTIILGERYIMHLDRSHGRLNLRQGKGGVRRALLISGMIATGAIATLGLWSAIRHQEGTKQAAQAARLNEVTLQNRLLVESFWSAVEVIRAQAVSLYHVRAARSEVQEELPLPTGNLLHWAELRLRGGRIQTMRQFARNPSWSNQNPAWVGDRGPLQGQPRPHTFEESYLNLIARTLSLGQLRDKRMALVRVRKDPQGASEWFSLIFAVPQSRSALVAVLVDPMDAFPVFQQVSDSTVRAYLIGQDGQVFAHSQRSYVGTSFKSAPIFSEAILPTMQGTRVSGAGTYVAIDRSPVTAAYLRLGSLPLGIVVERLGSPTPWEGRWRPLAAQGLIALGAIVLLVLGGIQIWGRVSRGRVTGESGQTEEERVLEEVQAQAMAMHQVLSPSPPESGAEPESMQDPAAEVETIQVSGEKSQAEVGGAIAGHSQLSGAQLSGWRGELAASREALRSMREENALLNQFESEAATLKDPKDVARRLTSVATRLTTGPTLFFLYHGGINAVTLQAQAGFAADEAPENMSFPISADLVTRIQQGVAQGKMVSIAEYPPLADLLLKQLGLAHFEAWAVTGYSHLGRQAGRPRLLGVLVILHAGTQSVSRRESIWRMVRATGLIYENTILSR